MPVVVAPVHSGEAPPALRLVGTVRPERAAVVATEVSGIVAEFAVEEGQHLRVGEVICRLEATLARLRVGEAEAELAGRQAQLAELENGERPEDVARLKALVDEAEAELRKTEFERQRVRELFERGQGNEKERHDAEMDCLMAAGRLAQARAQYEKARSGARAEAVARARQAVLAQQAALDRLRRDLEKTEIRAPFAGAVTVKRTDVGEWLAVGGAVCEMVALDTVKVRVDVPEAAVSFAQPGAPATVEIDALGTSHTATISRVIPQAAPAARTFPVEIDLPNADHRLLPGMFVWAFVPSGPRAERLMVSKDAIVGRGTSKQVFVLRPGPEGAKLAIPTPVTTGLELGGEVEIQGAGLAAGDWVVSRANERLYGPTPVIPTNLPAGPERAGGGASATRPAVAEAGRP